jgi:LysR family nitrogen assimilation transcriptional regulator
VKLPLILPSNTHGLRALLEKEAASRALQLNTIIEVDSYTNIKGLVEVGAGYSILPFNSIAREVQSGRLLAWRIGKPKLERLVNLVHPVDRPLTRAASSIESLCQRVLLNLASTGRWNGARIIGNELLESDHQYGT